MPANVTPSVESQFQDGRAEYVFRRRGAPMAIDEPKDFPHDAPQRVLLSLGVARDTATSPIR